MSATDSGTPSANTSSQDYSISITGMSCQHCVGAVRKALGSVAGVNVRDVRIGAADVSITAAGTSIDTVLDAIRDSGYEPSVA